MKSLLVVGASSEVGSALIKKVADSYDAVWAHYFHWNDKLQELQDLFGDKMQFVSADLSSVESMENMVAKIKETEYVPDHIVHFPMTKIQAQNFPKVPWDSFDKGWNVSVRSAVLLSQAFLPAMKKKKAGKIIYMLSSAVVDTPPKYESSYVTVKYAMLGLMKSLAAEYFGTGICINGVSPDMIQTKFLSDLPALLVEQYSQSRPKNKILSVEEILPTFEYLLSDGADHINGENICIK